MSTEIVVASSPTRSFIDCVFALPATTDYLTAVERVRVILADQSRHCRHQKMITNGSSVLKVDLLAAFCGAMGMDYYSDLPVELRDLLLTAAKKTGWRDPQNGMYTLGILVRFSDYCNHTTITLALLNLEQMLIKKAAYKAREKLRKSRWNAQHSARRHAQARSLASVAA